MKKINYESLFRPFKIGTLQLKNRLVFAPMGTGSAEGDGSISFDEIRYLEERAKGGVGMLITGSIFLTKLYAHGVVAAGLLDSQHLVPRLTKLVERCHRYDAKVICQLSAGVGRNALPNLMGEPPMSASAVPSAFDPNVICREMSNDDIQNIMSAFADSARYAKAAGFDGIEIHAHGGYLVDQFMSHVWNKRTDEYGGNAEGFARFPREIIRTIRNVVGPDMPILFRISMDHRFNGGRTIEQSISLIKLLQKEGIDALDVDAGCYNSLEYVFPPSYLDDACMDYVCAPSRDAVKVPLLNAGNHTPETAVKLIESGNCDLVMFGRPLIADPDLPNKLLRGERKNIRPCIRCNEDCIGRVLKMTKLSCSVNVQAMEEDAFAIQKTVSPKKVVVIGAGPAGLEAARVASLIGHQVIVLEKKSFIGGQLSIAATPRFKKQLAALVDWYAFQMDNLDIELKLGTEASTDNGLLEDCDQIIVATGAIPITPNIPGIKSKNVISVLDAHTDKSLIKGNRVVVCGGGLSGLDCALEMATQENKEVSVVDILPQLGTDNIINDSALFPALKKTGVQLFTSCKVIKIDDRGIEVEREDGSLETIEADTIVASFGMRANNELANKISEKFYHKTKIIGDCKKVSKVGPAIRSGFYAAMSLDN